MQPQAAVQRMGHSVAAARELAPAHAGYWQATCPSNFAAPTGDALPM